MKKVILFNIWQMKKLNLHFLSFDNLGDEVIVNWSNYSFYFLFNISSLN